MKLYQKNEEEVLKQLETSRSGLTSEEVKKRQEKYGLNQLQEEKQSSIFEVFLDQFKDLIVIILIVAAIISGFTGDHESSIVIIAVLIINAVLGTVQTMKSRKSIESLKKLSLPKVKVLRDGMKQEVDSTQLTIGDIVVFEAGDVIVGDGRIIEASSLQINESALTGESHAIDKVVDVIENEVTIGDQKNMVFTSSLVTYGKGVAVVSAIGEESEIGKIAKLLQNTKTRKTPLQMSIDEFSKNLSIGIILICIVVFGLTFYNTQDLKAASLFAIALAVAAVPEALAPIITIVLSLGSQKMAKENAIMKNINSVESLGSVSIICSDKTGTLTQNKMTVNDVYVNHTLVKPSEVPSERSGQLLLETCVLCNDSFLTADQKVGDPTEIALVELARQYGKNEHDDRATYKRISELPFDSVRKYMSTLQVINGEKLMLVKGACDEILKQCKSILINDEVREITNEDVVKTLEVNEQFAENGLRVLGYAFKNVEHDVLSFEDETNLTFVGLTSLIDPPREESREAVLKCIQAGIKPIMITGDHVVTARSIARKIGIFSEGDIVIDGLTLEKMSDEELMRDLEKISVYARVAPEHKIRIVNAWQAKGKIVGMSGDGVNDAPALKQADIGIAMGITGSEVSKDAAAMILTDDNFATIVKAVIMGRNIFANIKNSIKYLLTGNFSAIMVVILTTILAFMDKAFVVPFLPIQLLFINLATDSLPAISIGMEEGSDLVLNEKPRNPKESILAKETFVQVLLEGLVIATCVFIGYMIGLNTGPGYATTYAFLILCIARLFHGFSCRSEESLIKIGIFSNIYTVGAFISGMILVSIIVFIPFVSRIFGVQPLSMIQFGTIMLLAFIPTVLVQISKYVRRK